MPEQGAWERLQPCLLDRLTDERPRETRESRSQRVISLRRYRESVMRDLTWLLNSAQRPRDENIYEYHEVAKSVLNFGVPPLCGQTAGSLDLVELERELRGDIYAQPLPDSLYVKTEADMETGQCVLVQASNG